MATMDQLIAGLRAADAAGNSADAHAFAQAIEKMRSGAPAATATGDQPSMWDRIAASPAGRFAQENIVQLGLNAGAQVAGGIAAGPLGADVTQAAVQKYLAQPEEQAYQAALARNRNVPGYTQLRQQANQVQDKKGYGFGSEMFSPLQPTVSGLAAMVTNGGNLSAANAAADATSQARQQYEQQNPWLSLGANVLGGLLMARPVGAAEGVAGASRAAGEIPTIDELTGAAQQQYRQVEASGLQVKPEAVQNLAASARAAYDEMGDPVLTPDSTRALQIINEAASSPDGLSIQSLDTLRRKVAIARGAARPQDATLGGNLVRSVDDFVNGLSPNDVAGGQADRASIDALNSARQNWRIASKAEIVDEAMERAKNAVGANYTNAGYQTALRQQFRRIANSDALMGQFTADERDMILKIVRGGPMENLLRRIGKLAPTGTLSGAISAGAGYGIGAGVGGAIGGPVGAIALPVAGATARAAATRMGLGNVNALDQMVRSGGVMPPAQPMLGSPSLPATLPYGSLMTPLLLQQRRPQQYQ